MLTGIFPLVGTGTGLSITKLIKNRNKIKRLEKEVGDLKTPNVK